MPAQRILAAALAASALAGAAAANPVTCMRAVPGAPIRPAFRVDLETGRAWRAAGDPVGTRIRIDRRGRRAAFRLPRGVGPGGLGAIEIDLREAWWFAGGRRQGFCRP